MGVCCSLIVVSILGAVAGAAAIHYYRILRVSPAQKRIVDLRNFGQPRRGASSYSRWDPGTQTHRVTPNWLFCGALWVYVCAYPICNLTVVLAVWTVAMHCRANLRTGACGVLQRWFASSLLPSGYDTASL